MVVFCMVVDEKMLSSTKYIITQRNGKVNHFFLQNSVFVKEIFHA